MRRWLVGLTVFVMACGGAAAMTAATCPAPTTVVQVDTVTITKVDTLAADTVRRTDTLQVTDTVTVTDTLVVQDSVAPVAPIRMDGTWLVGSQLEGANWPTRVGVLTLSSFAAQGQVLGNVSGTLAVANGIPGSPVTISTAGTVDTTSRTFTVKIPLDQTDWCDFTGTISTDGNTVAGTALCPDSPTGMVTNWWTWVRQP